MRWVRQKSIHFSRYLKGLLAGLVYPIITVFQRHLTASHRIVDARSHDYVSNILHFPQVVSNRKVNPNSYQFPY